MILHILPSLETGGAERYVVEILKELKRKDVSAELLVFKRGWTPMSDELRKLNIKVNYTPFESYFNVLNIFYFIALFRSKTYKVIHAHLTYPQLWCSLGSLVKRKSIGLFTTEHSTQNNRRKYQLLKIIDKFMFNRYSRVFCISVTTRDSLLNWLNIYSNDKFPIVPNGINIEKFSSAISINRRDIGLDYNDRIIMMVGRLSDAKDQLTLIHAMNSLSEEYKLVIVGDGMNKDMLIKACKNDKRVIFLGDRTDIPELLKCCDIYVQSSHWEGLPTTVLEAMAAGKVVIGSNVKGNEDIIPKKQLFNHGDEFELSEMITQIVEADNHILIQEQDELLINYNLQNIVEKILFIYHI